MSSSVISQTSSWQSDKAWADQFMPDIERLIRVHAGDIISFRISTDQEDRCEATDAVVTVRGGKVGLRIRRLTPYRDITIRAWRKTGVKTELDKIRQGWGDWILYAWTQADRIIEYALIDLHCLRASGLLDARNATPNRDGNSGFIALSLVDLRRVGALVAHDKEEG